MTLSLIHGNALHIPLADQSVHLIVTSPPYFALRSYRDGDEHYDGQLGSEPTPLHFLAALWTVLDECWRVLRDDGSCWINLGDKFAGAGPQSNRNGLGPSTLKHDGRENPQPATSRQRYLSSVGNSKHWQQVSSSGLRPKSRMLLPHLFAAGSQYRWLRHAVEMEAGFQRTHNPPQWICRMDAVWAKANGLPESVTDRVRASHENWFHLVKSERYYSATDAIREPHLQPLTAKEMAGRLGGTGNGVIHGSNRGTSRSNGADVNTADMLADATGSNPLGKLPGSVWEVATEPLILPPDLPQHFAAFPSEFPRRIVLGWSPSGVCTRCGEGRRPVCQKDANGVLNDTSNWRSEYAYHEDLTGKRLSKRPVYQRGVTATITGTACACPTPDAPTTPAVVLDPFSGTGTAPIVAAALGRHGIGVDLSWDYHRITRWRDRDGGLRAKALGVDRPERQLAGQLDLFGGVA